MAKRSRRRLVIKEHRPWRGWLLSILLITVSGATGWLLPHQIPALLELTSTNIPPPSTLSPQKRLSYLERENTRLQEHLTRTRRELEIEQHARADLSASLVALQDEVLELNSQLATYKGLAKSLEEQGLHIQALTISKTETNGLLRYRLVLTQGREMDQPAQGQVQLVIHGILDGKPTRFELGSLSKDNRLTFKFKYFQILEGELLLPRNFKPTQVKIALLPKDYPSKPVERIFDWASLKA